MRTYEDLQMDNSNVCTGGVMQILVVLLTFLFIAVLILTSLQFMFYLSMMSKVTELNSTIYQIFKGFDLLCGKDWKYYDLKCYYRSPILQSWDSAKQDCAQLKSHLAIINGEDEMKFLETFSQNQNSWVGLREVKPGEWRWVDGTLHNTRMFWRMDEPNEFAKEEDCAHLRDGNGLNDAVCSLSFLYICERELS
ncbi:hepatic lectin-like isoform X2 [Pyxicephalus adspersus]|uniref:hepatic lectin-like isoform X2 n=1 Tax=Pyxicephalus adspersus TaxID=30357 RepID=UPI003B5CC9E5